MNEMMPADISRINVQLTINLFKERDYLIESVHTFILNHLSSLHSEKNKKKHERNSFKYQKSKKTLAMSPNPH